MGLTEFHSAWYVIPTHTSSLYTSSSWTAALVRCLKFGKWQGLSPCMSAAFDLLRPKTFWKTLAPSLDDDIILILIDFLCERKMLVEVEGARSKEMDVTLGCVQRSILGPKLFSFYIKDVVNHVSGHHLTSYADDTYVLVSEPDLDLMQKLRLKLVWNLILISSRIWEW